jgi:predicted methyltransferase
MNYRDVPPKWLATGLLSAALILPAGLPVWAASSLDAYDLAVQHAGRSAEDQARDSLDHPAEILRLAKIKPGMKVADVLAGGGYYSELLSYLVGPTGHVLMINNQAFDDFSDNGWMSRLAQSRLPNVEHRTLSLEHLELGKNSLDAILLIKVYHDLYWPGPEGPWPKFDPEEVLNQLVAALKPGGVLLLVDHSAKLGTGHSQAGILHRIDEDFARKDFTSRGLELLDHSDLLRNPSDQRTLVSFKSPILGKTDRFVLVFKKAMN